MAEISFTEPAIGDLRRIGPEAAPKVLREILLLADDVEAGHPLGGVLVGFRKLVVGRNTWRVVYGVTGTKTVEICEIWAVGARADAEVYAEATARVRSGIETQPELVRLASVIERLGRLAGTVTVEAAARGSPFPIGWPTV